MPKTAAPDWAAIRRRYMETDAAVADIASDAGISRTDLDKARKREGWLRSKPRGHPPRRRPAADPAVRPSEPKTPAPATPQAPIASPSRSAAAATPGPAVPRHKPKPARFTG